MQISRNKSKYKGIKRFYYSIKYSFNGLFYAYKNEKSLGIHGILSIITIILGFVLNISHTQWAVILISLAAILAFELVNTAMEAVVDMVTLEYNELARIAKDCCSGATFVMSLIGFIIAVVTFAPKIAHIFGWL